MALPASSPAGLDLVPPEHLEPPPGDQQRYVVRDECALLLDGYLRRLARQEACGRRVLGTLARAFLAQKGQHALGFARLGDFARERLGLSARELQSLAHVSARLAQLPAVAAAFAAGALSWTQVRLLVGVATAETAAAWVETARSRTVRALEANRITVCAWHHLRGIHQGRVRAWGTAPDDVTWELGVRPGCAPLLRLHGDEYLVDER